jgi:hypothetical protein
MGVDSGEEKRRKQSRGAWRVEIGVRAAEIHHRLAVATEKRSEGCLPGQSKKTRKAIATATTESLATAQAAATEVPPRTARLSDWRTGTAITTAWESIHEAEINVMRLETPEAIWTNISKLLVWIQDAMDSGYLRARHETELKAMLEAPTKAGEAGKPLKVDHAAVEQAFRDVVIANRERYASVRAFRNALVFVTVTLGGLIALLAIWHAADPGFVDLCGHSGKRVHCVSGTVSHASDLALIAMVGAVGGLMALAFGFIESEQTPTRYDPRLWQTILKPVAGAATALAGVLLLQANMLTGVVKLQSEAAVLSYALLLGFSQQLFTRLIDKRADTLISSE